MLGTIQTFYIYNFFLAQFSKIYFATSEVQEAAETENIGSNIYLLADSRKLSWFAKN